MTYSVPSSDYGIDLTLNEIRESRGEHTESGTRLEVQLKSTTRALGTRAAVAYDLPARAYNLLRRGVAHERLLLVLALPPDEAVWVRSTRAGLELAGPMYWVSLRGRPPVPNRSSVRVTIPRRQVFTPAGLHGIMARIRAGGTL